ncbi:MAG: hypothetical protein ACLPVO_17045 [Desulfomonilaceae bacterium]
MESHSFNQESAPQSKMSSDSAGSHNLQDTQIPHVLPGSRNGVLMVRRLEYLRSDLESELVQGIQSLVSLTLSKELELREQEGTSRGNKSRRIKRPARNTGRDPNSEGKID